MAGISRLDRMAPAVFDGMIDLFAQGRTVTEVTEWLAGIGLDISRSSVGRKRLSWARSVARLREVNEFASHVVRGLADKPETLTTRATLELLKGELFNIVTALDEVHKSDPEKAVKLLTQASKAAALIARATKDDAETVIKATDFADSYAPDVDRDTAGDALRIEFIRSDGASPATAANSENV